MLNRTWRAVRGPLPRLAPMLVAVAAVLAGAAVALGDVVELRDGRRYEGRITEQGDLHTRIDTMIAGIPTTLTFYSIQVKQTVRQPVPDGFFRPAPKAPAPKPLTPKQRAEAFKQRQAELKSQADERASLLRGAMVQRLTWKRQATQRAIEGAWHDFQSVDPYNGHFSTITRYQPYQAVAWVNGQPTVLHYSVSPRGQTRAGWRARAGAAVAALQRVRRNVEKLRTLDWAAAKLGMDLNALDPQDKTDYEALYDLAGRRLVQLWMDDRGDARPTASPLFDLPPQAPPPFVSISRFFFRRLRPHATRVDRNGSTDNRGCTRMRVDRIPNR